jgi:hypothetical protein
MKKLILTLSLTVVTLISNGFKIPSPEVNDEVISKMKTGLSPIFQENQDYVFSDILVTEASGGYKITGNATFFQIQSVTFIGTFSSADVFARFEIQFPEGSILPESTQKKLANQNFVNWIPGDIRKVVALKSLYVELAGTSIKTIEIQFAGQQDWKPINGISAKNILVDFNLNNPTSGVSVSSTMKSNVSLGKVTISTTATLSSNPNDCVLSGDVSGLSVGDVLTSVGMTKAPEWPNAFWDLAMAKGSLSIAPFAKILTLNTTTDFGQLEFSVNGATSDIIVGIAPPSDFSFARIDPSLGMLDNLGLKNTGIVLASSTQKTNLTIFKKLGQATEVTRGLTLLALYDIGHVEGS